MTRRQHGFTLVEMLLAMTLVALILGMAYSGLRTSARAVESGDELLDRANRLRIVHQFVRAQLRSVMPLQIPPENDFDEEILTYFEGDESMLHFAGPMPGYLSSGGPHEQRLYFDRGPDGNLELLFDHAPLLRDEEWPEQEEREPVVLMSGIRDGHFEYMALDEEGEPDEWQPEWEEPTTIPLMVRIAVEMEPFTRQTWPVLEVRPMLDAATGGRQLQRPFVLPGSRREGSE